MEEMTAPIEQPPESTEAGAAVIGPKQERDDVPQSGDGGSSDGEAMHVLELKHEFSPDLETIVASEEPLSVVAEPDPSAGWEKVGPLNVLNFIGSNVPKLGKDHPICPGKHSEGFLTHRHIGG